MRIRTFGKFIETENLRDHTLKDCDVVVDAQNFFYNIYQRSGLQYIFGCESDKYARHLKEYLSMFKKANVNCYFVFKGGHEDLMKRLTTVKTNELRGRNFNVNQEYDEIVLPLLMKDVYKQVLDEMGFNYTICKFEAKKECIALAQELKCPVISYDIEFVFAGVPYIMQSSLSFDDLKQQIRCGMFSLDKFLQKYRLTEEKLALFAALTDEKEFPENHFMNFLKTLKIPLGHYRRNVGIINWLGRVQTQQAKNQIFRYVTEGDRIKFVEKDRDVREMIRRRETPGIPAKYLLNGNNIQVTEKDPSWFEKGVASKHIAIQLINPVTSGIIEGTWAIADYADEDARLLSMDIIKYTYNLLTNYEKDEFIFYVDHQKIAMPLANSIEKAYQATCSPFENGWAGLKGELFEHFLTESLQGFDLKKLSKLPEDLRMLMVVLIYFSEKKAKDTRNEVCAVLLSYVALNIVADADKNNNSKGTGDKQATECLDKRSITDVDKFSAKGMLAKYQRDVGKQEAITIFDVKLLHPLIQFVHCLQSLNQLNILCGKLFSPTIYSKTYNGTFVYKILHIIKTEYEGDCMKFVKQILESAPTVFAFLQGIMEFYDHIMLEM